MRREKSGRFLILLLAFFTLNVVLNIEGSYRTYKINEAEFTLRDGIITYSLWNYMNTTDYVFQTTEIRNHSSLVEIRIASISNETLKIEAKIQSSLDEAYFILSDSTQKDPFGYNITMYPSVCDTEEGWEEDFILPHETSEINFVYYVDTQNIESIMEKNFFIGHLVLKYSPLNETGDWGAHESLFAFGSANPKSFIDMSTQTWQIGDVYLFDWARKVGWHQQLYEEKYTVTKSGIFQGFDTWILEVLDILEPYESTTKVFYNIAEYEKDSGVLIRHDFKEVREEEGNFRDERQSHIWMTNNSLLITPTLFSSTNLTSSTLKRSSTIPSTQFSSSNEVGSTLPSSSITPSLSLFIVIISLVLIYGFKKIKVHDQL